MEYKSVKPKMSLFRAIAAPPADPICDTFFRIVLVKMVPWSRQILQSVLESEPGTLEGMVRLSPASTWVSSDKKDTSSLTAGPGAAHAWEGVAEGTRAF